MADPRRKATMFIIHHPKLIRLVIVTAVVLLIGLAIVTAPNCWDHTETCDYWPCNSIASTCG